MSHRLLENSNVLSPVHHQERSDRK